MQHKINSFLFAVVIIIAAFFPRTLIAQRIDATVTFHTDQLSQEEKDFIAGLDEKLERAIEENHWEGARRNYVLNIKYDIFWDKATRVGAVHNYSAGLLISLESGLALRDKRAEFRYSPADLIRLGEPYEPLTGLIEFYTWICLAFDVDRVALLGGNPFYLQANATGERARAEAQFSLGWDDRRALANELTDSLYFPMRRARFHAEAANFYIRNANEAQTKSNLDRAVNLLTKSKAAHAIIKKDDHVFRFVDIDLLMKSVRDMKMDEQEYRLEQWMMNEKMEEQ